MEITYYGHDVFMLVGEKAKLIIDPFIEGQSGDVNMALPKLEDILVDYVLLTHAHQDHIGDGMTIAKRCDATIIAPFETAMICESEGCKVHPMHIGGGFNFGFGRVKLTIAHHGSGYITDSGIQYGGNPCGFLVTMDGKTIYHSGDTGLFLDMKLIGELSSIDVALLPIGDNFTMGIDDAVKATEFLNAKLNVPMHYDTFDVIKADPMEFAKKVTAIGGRAKVMEYGSTITI